jgi:hypothetical protein
MVNEIVFLQRIILFIVNLMGLWFGFWIYIANKRERANQWFLIMTILLLLWINSAYLGSSSTHSLWALFWYRLNLGAVALCGLAAYYFSISFLKEENRYPLLNKIIVLISLSFFFFSLFTPYIVADVAIKSWGAEIIFEKGNLLFLHLFLYF